MNNKPCCPKCGTALIKGQECGICPCHKETTPPTVSEVIAEAVKEHREIYGESPIENAEDAWLTTTLSHVASVAREEAVLKIIDDMTKKYAHAGGLAMMESILAAIPRDHTGDAGTVVDEIVALIANIKP